MLRIQQRYLFCLSDVLLSWIQFDNMSKRSVVLDSLWRSSPSAQCSTPFKSQEIDMTCSTPMNSSTAAAASFSSNGANRVPVDQLITDPLHFLSPFVTTVKEEHSPSAESSDSKLGNTCLYTDQLCQVCTVFFCD